MIRYKDYKLIGQHNYDQDLTPQKIIIPSPILKIWGRVLPSSILGTREWKVFYGIGCPDLLVHAKFGFSL